MKLGNIFKKVVKQEEDPEQESNVVAKERLQLVLMQDRANVSAEFLEMMKNEIVSVVQKYIDVDEEAMDIRLTTEPNEDGTNGIPRIYANIPIIQIKNEAKFGRLQIQNAYGEVISEIGGNKEPSKFAEVNDGDIFAEGEDEEEIEIEGTVIDRKEDVEEDNQTPVKTIIQETSTLESSIEDLEEYNEDEDDDYEEDDEEDVTFDDLLEAAEKEDKNRDEELKRMKAVISDVSDTEEVQDQELEEDSLLQKLSNIDEEENEINNVDDQKNYVPNKSNSHSKKHKKNRKR